MSRHPESEGEVASRCALDIRKSYQLDGLLGATKLEKIRFRTSAPEFVLVGLAEVIAWLDKGFQERSQKVVIEMR